VELIDLVSAVTQVEKVLSDVRRQYVVD